MKELEKRGIPTVAIVSDDFVDDHRRSADSHGIASLPYARVDEPLVSQSASRIDTLVDAAIDQIVVALTSAPANAAGELHKVVVTRDDWLSFSGSDLLNAWREMNDTFLEWQIGDGFPLVPPTRDSVEAILAGTTRDRDEVIGLLEPGAGAASVAKIAINAVMAGCQPHHLPIVIAAVECLADPAMNLKEKAISTGPAAPMIVVNGPARKAAGLNTGICMLGPGAPSRANSVIGRAVRLCMMNLGHTYAKVSDMDTIGSPNKYSMCLAENEEHSPWVPYHVEGGAEHGTSSVTVGFVYGLVDVTDYHSLDPETAVGKWATAAKYLSVTSTGYWLVGRRSDPRFGNEEQEHHYLLLAPQHARVFAAAGWSQKQIREALFRHARLPFGFVRTRLEEKAIRTAHPELSWLWDSPDALVPVLEDEDCFDVIVAGSPGSNRSSFAWGMGGPHNKPIPEADVALHGLR